MVPKYSERGRLFMVENVLITRGGGDATRGGEDAGAGTLARHLSH